MTEEEVKAFAENILARARSSYPTVTGDYVADCWIHEILQNAPIQLPELLEKVNYILKHGRGYLASTNSERVALAHIAEDYHIKLTDGCDVPSSPTKVKEEEK